MTPADKDLLGDEIAELAAHMDAATHQLLMLIARFDDAGGWADQGARSCAHWLSWRIGLNLGAAREHVRVARALRDLPQIADALRRGAISYSKSRALTRVATAENETALLAMARASTACQLERVCRSYETAVRNASGSRPEDDATNRWVRERHTGTGFVRFEIQLAPEEAAAVRQALELAMARGRKTGDVSAETRLASLQRADALVAMVERYLAAAEEEHDAGPPVEVVVHVEADTQLDDATEVSATLDDGTPLSRATTERLQCDAAVVRVVEDSRGNVLDVGRRRRTIPKLLRRALRLRDRGCRWPGCGNRHVDGHHLVPWSRGGKTAIGNLVLMCRRHHGYVHEHGIRIEPEQATRRFRFFRADGAEVTACGVPPALGPDPVDRLRLGQQALGVEIHATTNLPQWDGRPADYGHIVWTLMPGDGAGVPELP